MKKVRLAALEDGLTGFLREELPQRKGLGRRQVGGGGRGYGGINGHRKKTINF